MLWRSIINWTIAGCLSATALNFSTGYEGPSVPPPVLPTVSSNPVATSLGEAHSESTSKPTEPTLSEAVSPALSSPAKVESLPGQSSASTQETSILEEYRVQPEDILQITVYEEPDLTTKVRVSGSREINFPLLGRVSVAQLSVIEIQEKLTKLLAQDYLVNPQIQVFIDTYHARNVFVTGSVNKPGSYPLPAGKPTTLMEAITMAGGFSQRAAVNGTRIIRIENGHETTLNVKANDIIKKGDKTKDVEVRPNDVIFIPESFF